MVLMCWGVPEKGVLTQVLMRVTGMPRWMCSLGRHVTFQIEGSTGEPAYAANHAWMGMRNVFLSGDADGC